MAAEGREGEKVSEGMRRNLTTSIQHLATAVLTASAALGGSYHFAVAPARAEVETETATVTAADAFGADAYQNWLECMEGRKVCEAELRACREGG